MELVAAVMGGGGGVVVVVMRPCNVGAEIPCLPQTSSRVLAAAFGLWVGGVGGVEG